MRLQFDDLTFDADSRQLLSHGKEIRLSPKAFDLLALLIDRRPNAVSKADIRQHLWPGTFVSESSLPPYRSTSDAHQSNGCVAVAPLSVQPAVGPKRGPPLWAGYYDVSLIT
jgi:hypothetical protein